MHIYIYIYFLIYRNSFKIKTLTKFRALSLEKKLITITVASYKNLSNQILILYR